MGVWELGERQRLVHDFCLYSFLLWYLINATNYDPFPPESVLEREEIA